MDALGSPAALNPQNAALNPPTAALNPPDHSELIKVLYGSSNPYHPAAVRHPESLPSSLNLAPLPRAPPPTIAPRAAHIDITCQIALQALTPHPLPAQPDLSQALSVLAAYEAETRVLLDDFIVQQQSREEELEDIHHDMLHMKTDLENMSCDIQTLQQRIDLPGDQKLYDCIVEARQEEARQDEAGRIVIVTGIPEKDRENTPSVVQAFLAETLHALGGRFFLTAHRSGPHPRRIIIQCTTKRARDEIIARASLMAPVLRVLNIEVLPELTPWQQRWQAQSSGNNARVTLPHETATPARGFSPWHVPHAINYETGTQTQSRSASPPPLTRASSRMRSPDYRNPGDSYLRNTRRRHSPRRRR